MNTPLPPDVGHWYFHAYDEDMVAHQGVMDGTKEEVSFLLRSHSLEATELRKFSPQEYQDYQRAEKLRRLADRCDRNLRTASNTPAKERRDH